MLEVDLDDLEGFSKEPELVEHLERNTQQYLTLLAEAADNIMPQPTEDDLPEDVFDVLLDQVRACLFGKEVEVWRLGVQCWEEGAVAAPLRRALLCFPGVCGACCAAHPLSSCCHFLPANKQRRRAQEIGRAQMEVEGRAAEGADPNFALPPSLLRRYEVLVRPRTKAARRTMREISADCIGSLVTFKGICTQVGGRGCRGAGRCGCVLVADLQHPARSILLHSHPATAAGVGCAAAANRGHLSGRPDRL